MNLLKSSRLLLLAVLALCFLSQPPVAADDSTNTTDSTNTPDTPTEPPKPEPNYSTNADGSAQTDPITAGLRVFTCGNSFHAWFIAPILKDMAEKAGIRGHEIIGVSKIGGSRAIQHWEVPEDRNEAKAALHAGKVDVLTLACMLEPDDGIEKFTKYGLQYNPNIRVTIQEFWIPSDKFEWPYQGDISKVDFDASTIPGLRKMHEPYFRSMDNYVRDLNVKLGTQALFAVPAGQAILNLREKIVAGEVPEIQKQSALFADTIGHPQPPLQALVAYCNFAVIYRHNPIGMPMPNVLTEAHNPKWDSKLNRLLQELAWDAVTHNPYSGVPNQPAAQ